MSALFESDIPGLKLIQRGKVRDIYDIDDKHMLIVTTDRLSAFDVIMSQPIPGKGEVLTRVANFWFERIKHIIPNQLADMSLEDVVTDPAQREILGDRALIVKKLKPLPVEAIVRGYIIGSGWKDYQQNGSICGIPLPDGLQMADKLPQALFTPSTKAELGEHDENIDLMPPLNFSVWSWQNRCVMSACKSIPNVPNMRWSAALSLPTPNSNLVWMKIIRFTLSMRC